MIAGVVQYHGAHRFLADGLPVDVLLEQCHQVLVGIQCFNVQLAAGDGAVVQVLQQGEGGQVYLIALGFPLPQLPHFPAHRGVAEAEGALCHTGNLLYGAGHHPQTAQVHQHLGGHVERLGHVSIPAETAATAMQLLQLPYNLPLADCQCVGVGWGQVTEVGGNILQIGGEMVAEEGDRQTDGIFGVGLLKRG